MDETADKTPKRPAKLPNLRQISGPGLDISGGLVFDSTIRELRGPQAFDRFREMADHSAVIGACLFAIEMLIRKVPWRFQPGDESDQEHERAEILDGMLKDMSNSWEDTISEILSMLVYGFAFAEVVYKVRKGTDQTNPSYYSRFNDGLVGWRKWVVVPQETLHEWKFDDEGGVAAMVQRPVSDFRMRTIPIEKALLFRTKVARNNPNGRSLLVNAFYPWQFVKRIQEFEGIGMERDLAGLPTALVPPELFREDATQDDRNFFESIKKLVTGVRRNSQEGIVFPMAYDDENNPLYEFKLLATGGMRQFDTNKIIERYERRMAMSLLSDFILMGHERVGSLALSRDKTTLIGRALAGIMGSIAAVINRHAVPKLYKLNGWPTETMCEIVPGEVENSDLKTLGAYLKNLASVGLVTPDPGLEASLREIAGLPKIDPEYVKGPDDMPDGGDPEDPNADPNADPKADPEDPDADPEDDAGDGDDDGDAADGGEKPKPKSKKTKNWTGAGSTFVSAVNAAEKRRQRKKTRKR